MIRRLPKSTRTDTLFPYTTLFRSFWHSVIAEFARSEWTDHQLEMAAMLARAMADLEREQYELRAEGSVMTSESGTPVDNPRKTVVQMTAGTIQRSEERSVGKERVSTCIYRWGR